MSDITLRNVKGTPLTNQEVDDNFSNLNADKYQAGDSPTFADITADSLQASVVYASNSNSDNWTTAYGWGNHATAGYQPANTALTTSTNFNGDVTGVYNNLVITGYNNTNWDTAYGWGNHATAGYLTAVPDNYVLTAGDTMTGDLSISKAAATINLGASTGPHGIQFYDSDSTLKWGFYYRTTPDTITFELDGSSAKFTLDTSGNLTLAGTLSASGYNNTNWDTAYTYSQVGHLPLAGGTITGNTVISSSGTIGTTNPTNGFLQITDGTNTLALDPNEIYSNAGQLVITTGAGIRVDGSHVTTNTISNWNTAYGWGNHAGLYELVKKQTATNINNSGTDMTGLDDGWYKWGSTKPTDAPFNYASMLQLSDTNQKIQMAFGSSSRGRLAIRRADSGTFYGWTSVWTDADFSSTKIGNWDTAYGWGNHATAGYLTSASLTGYATETYVNTAVSNLVDSAPATLDTLNELAAALGDDPNFATTVSTSIGTKWTQDNTKISNWDTAYTYSQVGHLPLAGGTIAGTLTVASTADAQINLNGNGSTWAGIGFSDVNSAGYDHIWHYGNTKTFAIGGGGAAVAGKKLHVDGGTTIGSTYDSVTPPTDGLYVQGDIKADKNLWQYNNSTDAHLGLYSANGAKQRADSRDESTFARTHWYGVSDTGGTSNFRHAWYDGNSYVNVTAENDGVTFTGTLNPTQGYKVSGTTVIDSSRNLTNIADANFGGDVTINSNNAAAKYLRINKGTGDGGILWELSDILKFQNVISGNDLNWYSYELGQTSFTMFGSGQFSARNGYQVNGTTVIDSSRNLTNIGTITNQGTVFTTAPNTSDDVHLHRWRYTADNSYMLDLHQRVTSGVVRYSFGQHNNGTTYNDMLVFKQGKIGFGTQDPSENLDLHGGNFAIGGTTVIDSSRNLTNIGTLNGGTPWHSGVDGSGSGLDADLLDGQQGSYYLNAANFTGTAPTGSPFLSDFVHLGDANGTGYSTDDGNWGARLNVSSTVHAKIEVSQQANNMRSHWYAHTGQDSIKFGTSTAHDVEFQRASSTKFQLTAGGSIASEQMLFASGNIQRGDHHYGHLVGSYNNVGANSDKTNPIYTIGTAYQPTATSFSNMYGIGYAHPNLWGTSDGKNVGWGQYAVEGGVIHFIAGIGGTWSKNEFNRNGNKVWDAGNDGSGSGLDADLLDGYNSAENGGNTIHRLASNGYSQLQNWTNVGGAGLYSSTINGAHFYPNTTGSYGAWRIDGARGSYTGIYLNNGGGVVTGMYDSSGNGGDYASAATGGWHYYYHRGNRCMGVGDSTTSSSYGLYEQAGGIYSTGNITAYSDRRVKENIRTIDNALETVEQMRGVYYNRIDDEEKKTVIGFIAQEIDEIEGAKPLVTYAEDVDQYGVSYGNTAALLVEAIKELSQQVKELQQEIKELKNA